MKALIYPEFLKKNTIIGVTAPSDGNKKDTDFIRLDNGKSQLKKRGYSVIETSNVRDSINGRSSDAKTRARQLMELISNDDVKWIVSAAGGDYLLEILPYVDFNKIKNNPKWFQGYSDNTGLTYTITTICDLATVYSNNFNDFGMANWHKSLENNLKIIEGKESIQTSFDYFQDGFHTRETGLEDYILEKPVFWKNIYSNDKITLKGRLLGGCLDVLISLVGTRYDQTEKFLEKYKEDGILWYLESFALTAESLTLALWQLKEAGWFQYTKGFVFGRPTFYDEEIGSSYKEVVHSVLGNFNVPILLDGDIGHKPPQMTMINGALTTISWEKGKAQMSFEFV